MENVKLRLVHFSTRVRSADPPSRATMQYFTPQEMAGGMRYGGKCKVGNWNESATLDEVRFRLRRRETASRVRSTRFSSLGAPPTSPDPPIPSPAADSRPGVPRQEASRHAEDGPVQRAHGQGARTGTSALPRRPNSASLARVSAKRFLRYSRLFFFRRPGRSPRRNYRISPARRSP